MFVFLAARMVMLAMMIMMRMNLVNQIPKGE
jgi:hypothetical protein